MGELEKEGCSHYQRSVLLVSPCCGQVFPCRFCHDEAVAAQVDWTDPSKAATVHHTLDRRAVVAVECGGCGARQPPAATCTVVGCGTVFGTAYHCLICRLWDHVDKGQFHCEGCGICRVGGREKYQHCNTCGICLPVSAPHRCVTNSSRANCPVCMEDLHSSREPAHIPPCSHLLHTSCYRGLVRSGHYACPTCGLSMQDMASVWEAVDREVAATPMPPQYAGLHRAVLCRDCQATTTVPFHIVGMKCGAGGCGSYNTTEAAGPLLVALPADPGSYRPITEEELAALSNGPAPPSPAGDNSDTASHGSAEDEGWETTEEADEDTEEMAEEDLD